MHKRIILLVVLALQCALAQLPVTQPSERLTRVVDGSKTGYMNGAGQWVVPAQFAGGGEFSEGLAPVMVEGKWGYIDETGKLAIASQFDIADMFIGGLANVGHRDAGGGFRFGAIDRTGTLVVPEKFKQRLMFFEGLSPMSVPAPGDENVTSPRLLYGYVDRTGEFAIPAKFDWAWPFVGGYATVREGGKIGYIDHAGKYWLAPQFEIAYAFADGIAVAHKEGKVVFITPDGQIHPTSFTDTAAYFSENRLLVVIDGKVGFADKSGQVVIAPEFEMSPPARYSIFKGGLAPVAVNKKWGYIDTTGKFVIAPQFLAASFFSRGLAHVLTFASETKPRAMALIDTSARTVWEFQLTADKFPAAIAAADNGAPATTSMRIRVSTGVAESLLTRKVAPVYPPIARQARIQGSVILQVRIGRDGSIQEIRVVSGHPMLIQSAIDCAKQWQYKPYFLNGEPVEVETQVTVNFTLSEPSE
jgi:TonB family protein